MRNAYHDWSIQSLSPIKNGTSGHRGVTGAGFSQKHVMSMTQALAYIRLSRGSFGPELAPILAEKLEEKPLGPIVIGKDVRYTSDFAHSSTIGVFAGNEMRLIVDKEFRATPTPVISHEILQRNLRGENVEGVIITASHNPPEEGGYKTNGRDGGPNTLTKPIDERGNYYMAHFGEVKSTTVEEAINKGLVTECDFMKNYVNDLGSVIDVEVLKGKRFAVTPLGGSAWGYYEKINETYGTNIEVIMPEPDPQASNSTCDWDGKLRRDPSSVYVMRAIQGKRQKLDVPYVGANDNDADRYGGEDATGILNPNHVFCVATDYVFNHRNFPKEMGIGRTIGTTHMLDLIAKEFGRPVYEHNVGWKHFVKGILESKYAIIGEESSSFSIPRIDGSIWVTEKDGILANLLIMEAIAKTGKDIGTLYKELVAKYGAHQYERVDMEATQAKKDRLGFLASNDEEIARLLFNKTIAGRNIERLKIGDGVKVVLEGGVWVLKRASGTEPIIKDYREEKGPTLETARQASIELDDLFGLK
jgi:phosphoglucomutase